MSQEIDAEIYEIGKKTVNNGNAEEFLASSNRDLLQGMAENKNLNEETLMRVAEETAKLNQEGEMSIEESENILGAIQEHENYPEELREFVEADKKRREEDSQNKDQPEGEEGEENEKKKNNDVKGEGIFALLALFIEALRHGKNIEEAKRMAEEEEKKIKMEQENQKGGVEEEEKRMKTEQENQKGEDVSYDEETIKEEEGTSVENKEESELEREMTRIIGKDEKEAPSSEIKSSISSEEQNQEEITRKR